jgi:hypothetical protein
MGFRGTKLLVQRHTRAEACSDRLILQFPRVFIFCTVRTKDEGQSPLLSHINGWVTVYLR